MLSTGIAAVFELHDERDGIGRGKCLRQLGSVAFRRFEDAKRSGETDGRLVGHLNDAIGFYDQALALTPQDSIESLAVIHTQLGNIYDEAGDSDRSLTHSRAAIRYAEMAGDTYGAAQTRFNVALSLARSGNLADALEYASAALRNYETFGERATTDIQETQELIALIASHEV